jgi:hypothetical protein
MNKEQYIQFIKTSTPGPYDVPLKVVNVKNESISFEIEIDNVIHTFEISRKNIISDIPSEDLETRLVEIDSTAMSSLYSKICSVMKSEENRFML